MKLIKNTLVILIVFLFFSFFILADARARENVSDWYIKDFQNEVVVYDDSSLIITERIVADCGNAPNKHGIFRIFPKEQVTTDFRIQTPIELISITNDKNQPWAYSVEENNKTITYKIGDSNKTVKGENTFIIKYKIQGLISNLNEKEDELYFDILGSFWDLEIDNWQAKIIFPLAINQQNSDVYLYSGALDDTNNIFANYNWSTNNILEIKANRTIKKKEGITVSVTFPTKILTLSEFKVSELTTKKFTINNLISILSPINGWRNLIGQLIIGLVLAFSAFWLWLKSGRDPNTNRPVIAEFEVPENLSPLEVAGILRQIKVRNNAITASIINLAVKGYLKIEKIEKVGLFSRPTYKFIKIDKATDNLYKYETEILNILFKTKNEFSFIKSYPYDLSSKNPLVVNIKTDVSNDLKLLPLKVHNDLKQRGYFDPKAIKKQIWMIIFGGFLFALSFGGLLIIAGLAFVIFGALMGRLTSKGAELKRQILGYKLYLTTAEKYRARFYEKENMFEKLLPYAILFGLTKEWLKKMRDIYGDNFLETHQLGFITGTAALANFSDFESMISGLSSEISSHMSPSSSGSHGGGSVGGGGGGGGGGGW